MNGEILNFRTLAKLHSIDKAKTTIEKHIKVNKRCLQEKLEPDIKNILELEMKYDKELLKILNLQ